MVRGRELLLSFLLLAAVTVWRLWPLPTALPSHLIDQGSSSPLIRADLHLIIWVLAWDSHAMLAQPWSLFSANSFYPAPTSLAYSEHLLGYVPLFAPVYWLTGNPVLAANTLILALFPLRGMAMYLLARRFVPPAAATLAALLFAFQPEALAELMKFHLIGVIGLPLALFFTERWLEAGRTRDAVLLALCLLQQAASSVYLAFALAFAYATYLPFALVGWRRSLDARRVVGLALAGGSALLCAGLLALPYLSLESLGIVPRYGEASGKVVGLALAPALAEAFLVAGGVGLVGQMLAAASLLPPLLGRGRVVLLGTSLVIVGFFVSAGPEPRLWGIDFWTPYRLLMSWMPGFATVRLPSRFLVVSQLGFCLLAALGAARLLRRFSAGTAWVACLAAGALAVGLQPSASAVPLLRHPVGDQVPAAYRWLAEHGAGRPLLELPRPSWPDAARRMLLSSHHWLPIIDGYSGHTPKTDDYLHGIAIGLPAPGALQRLVDLVDVGWILVHERELQPAARQRWNGPLPEGLEPAARFDSDRLFRVTRQPQTDLRARLTSTTETLEGHPRALLTKPCPGELRVVPGRAQPWPARQLIPLTFDVRNLGAESWPAAGVIPKNLVRLTLCLEKDAEPGCSIRFHALASDVPPGGSTQTRVAFWTPRAPGEYTLIAELVQVGGKPLARCGVPPLRIPVRVSEAPGSARDAGRAQAGS